MSLETFVSIAKSEEHPLRTLWRRCTGQPRRKLNLEEWLSPPETPPYSYFTQIGDPVLRAVATPVSDEEMNSEEIMNIISRMVSCIRRYGCSGLAAPQIGIPKRIIVLEFTEETKKLFGARTIERRKISVMPLMVFINPFMEIMSTRRTKFGEGCMSVCGYGGDVVRYEKCRISGVGRLGTPNLVYFSGWNARIAQHQMDHLNGKFFTDIMEPKTLHFIPWKDNIETEGKHIIIFHHMIRRNVRYLDTPYP